MNIRTAVSAFAAALLITHATAQDRPTLGQVTAEVENWALTYECDLLGQTLHCQFAQGRVGHSTPKSAADLDAQAGQLMGTVTDDQCDSLRQVRDQLASDTPTLPAPLAGQALEDARAIMESYTTFCDTRSAVAARAAVAATEDKDRRTCSFGIYLFELDFTWNYQTQRWETVSSPQGACGIVTAAFFEPDKSVEDTTFWNFRQRKIATNKTGEELFLGKCAEYPESDLTAKWQTRELNPQCDYVKFSPF